MRPVAVACCDLDVGVAQGVLPMPPGHAVGHEGVAEVVAVGDAVTQRRGRRPRRGAVPDQLRPLSRMPPRRTGSCGSRSVDGDVRHGPTGRAGWRRLHGRSGAGAVRRRDADSGSARRSIRSPSRRCRTTSPTVGARSARSESELDALDDGDRRVLVVGRLSIGVYAAALASAIGAHVDYVDTDQNRLAAAEKLGAVVHDLAKPDRSWDPYPVTVHTSGDPALLAATLRATWPDGVCTDTGIYSQGKVEMPLLPMYTRGVRFVTGRVNARAVIPEILELLAAGCDLAPAVERVVDWDDAPSAWPTMTGKTVFTRR